MKSNGHINILLGHCAVAVAAVLGMATARAEISSDADYVGSVLSTSQTVGVQMAIDGYGTPLDPTQMAGVIPQNNFNTVTVGYGDTDGSTIYTGTTGSLLASDGSFTGITLTHTSHDSYTTGSDPSTANGNLLHFADKTGGNKGGVNLSSTYTFNNLPVGTYNLIAYIASDQNVSANLTAGGTTYYVIDATVSGNPAFTNANNINPAARVTGNYVEFFGLVPNSNGQITLTNVATTDVGNDTAAVNGLQLQPTAILGVPEPSTWAMLLGGVGLLVAAQRFRRLRRA